MRKILLSALVATAIFANGGFMGASENTKIISVKEALKLRDDAFVALEGRIKSKIKKEHYKFVDINGDVIEIEIDDDKWGGVSADENTLLRIYGEIDKEFSGTKIEVERVELVR